jgi:hypothetical protein
LELFHEAVVRQYFGSRPGAGVSYGGIDLSLGPDLMVIATGTVDANGAASATVTPLFQGTTLDRYRLQAATSPSPAFQPLALSVGRTPG